MMEATCNLRDQIGRGQVPPKRYGFVDGSRENIHA
jgi:hypothetical protein